MIRLCGSVIRSGIDYRCKFERDPMSSSRDTGFRSDLPGNSDQNRIGTYGVDARVERLFTGSPHSLLS
jgi:hypothetical protein